MDECHIIRRPSLTRRVTVWQQAAAERALNLAGWRSQQAWSSRGEFRPDAGSMHMRTRIRIPQGQGNSRMRRNMRRTLLCALAMTAAVAAAPAAAFSQERADI